MSRELATPGGLTISPGTEATRVIQELQERLSHTDMTIRRQAARALRKLADELDPPASGIPPHIGDVEDYCYERENGISAEQFCDYYQAQGWVLANGRKMKDWRAAVRTWEHRERSPCRGNTTQVSYSAIDRAFR